MEGSNLAPDNPLHSNAGAIVVLQRKGRTFVKSLKNPRLAESLEGVAFSSRWEISWSFAMSSRSANCGFFMVNDGLLRKILASGISTFQAYAIAVKGGGSEIVAGQRA